MSQLSEPQRQYWEWSSTGKALLTAWTRVEGQKHCPSDVLAGYALGNLIGTFVEPLRDTDTHADIAWSPDGAFYIHFSRAW